MENYQPIFEAIRQHCAAQGWYGAEMLGPEHRNVRDDDPRWTDFAFPPVTETQMQEVEHRLGLSLPPMLRACYTELANGDFGPGYGLRSVIGGPEYLSDLLDSYPVLDEDCEVLDIDVMAASKGGTQVFEIPFDRYCWVRAVLPLIEEGCARTLCLDATSGSIFRVGPTATGRRFRYMAPNFETLLGQWLSDEILPLERHLFLSGLK